MKDALLDVLGWIMVVALLMLVFSLLDMVRGESVPELQKQEMPRPPSLKTATQCSCRPFKWKVKKTGKIMWSIAGVIRFYDRLPWVAHIKAYYTEKMPKTVKKDCLNWLMFIRDAFWKEQLLVNVQMR